MSNTRFFEEREEYQTEQMSSDPSLISVPSSGDPADDFEGSMVSYRIKKWKAQERRRHKKQLHLLNKNYYKDLNY